MSPDEAGQFLTTNYVSYVFFGPRERALGGSLPLGWGDLVFESQDTRVYRLNSATLDTAQP
jgi:hypothetical protein